MMKSNQLKRREIAIFLAFAVTLGGFIFSRAIGAQETKRERVISAGAVGPTPTVSPTPTVISPSVTTTGAAVQTVGELQSKIRSILSRPQLQRGQVGVKIVALGTNKIIFEENAEKFFMPASNMKNFVVAAALERLSPDFRFVTSVYAPAAPDAAAGGTIRGDLIIYGRGDPSFSTAFNDKDYFKGMNNLADKIVAAGVKRIEGGLIGDESYFTGEPIPSTWEWDDLQWYYGAEVSALTVNDNALDLIVRPGAAVGAPAGVQLLPAGSGALLVNNAKTGAPGSARTIGVRRRLGSDTIEVFGSMPKNLDKFETYVSVPKPALAFVSMLRRLLEQKGVVITGQTRTVDAEFRRNAPLAQSNPVEITKLESPPLTVIAQKTMKPSQNLYTELLLRAMGEAVGDKTNAKWTSVDRGIAVVDNFLREIGVAPGSVLMYDGSGLSRHNLVTPNAVVGLYTSMHRSRSAAAWHESLTIAGVDGTLQNRFQGTRAANNIRGKTGTFDQVSSLGGYVTSAAGEQLVFSIITNNIPSTTVRTAAIDDIALTLANFNGRTN